MRRLPGGRYVKTFARSFCTAGLLMGTLFFAASLTPSLLPRTPITQGAVSGAAFSAGYFIGVLMRWLWVYLGLPVPRFRLNLAIQAVAAAGCIGVAVYFLYRMTGWQNSIRAVMEMEPTEGVQRVQVALVATAVFGVFILLARLFSKTYALISALIHRRVPVRLANVLGFSIALALFWTLANGVAFNYALRAFDSSYRQLDALIETGPERPREPRRTGSEASLIDWNDVGRQGRQFLGNAPRAGEIAALSGRAAVDPIRVYAGLNSAETIEERADLAFEELKRVGAFNRSALVVATPTGTGRVNPPGITPIEYMLDGDVATVAVQYSYLASWLALLTEPGYGAETARVLFDRVYEHWRTLPQDDRPRLYLYGLSLGALNSDLSFDLFDVIGDPIHGALWSGPPFSKPTWQTATRERRPGTPAWLPQFRDGSVIRFANQFEGPDVPGAEWGPMRIVYLQYASDPITFFEPEILYRRPDWLAGEIGPDVSPELRWYPVVTFLQLIADMPASMAARMGFGHVYAPEHYIRAWRAVADPPGWSDEAIADLEAHFAQR